MNTGNDQEKKIYEETHRVVLQMLTPDDFPSLDQNVYKSKNVTDMNCSTFENGVPTKRCVSSSVDINISKSLETDVPIMCPEPTNISESKNYNVLGDPNDIDMSALGELDFIFTEVVPKKPKRRRGCRGALARKRRPRWRIKYDNISENCSNANGINLIESQELNQSESNELNQSLSTELNQSESKELNQSGFTELNQAASKEFTDDKKLIEAKVFDLHEPVKLNVSEAKELNLSHFQELHLSPPRRLNLFGPNQFNLYNPEEFNIPVTNGLNLPQPTELNVSGPNQFNLSQPTKLNLAGPNQLNLYKPQELNISGPNVFSLSQPTKLNLPGANRLNLYKPQELNIPGPKVFNLSQPTKLNQSESSKFNSSIPKELSVSEPNQQVIKKTKRVNFGPVTVNILDIIQKSKSQLKKEEQEKRRAECVRQRAKKLRKREAKRKERYEGNTLDASQPDRQRGKHREFAKEKKPSKLKQLIQRDAAAAEEDAKEKETEVVESWRGKPKYSEFHINYSNNVITQELDSAVTAFLTKIVQFQENLYERDPIKGDTRRRYFVGFKVVRKFLLLKKIKILVVSPDIKAKRQGDTLDNMINNIVSLAAASEIPYVFALSRRKMGQITLKNVPICCVAVADCDGTEKEFEKVLQLIQVTRDEYQKTKPLDAQAEQTKEIIDDFLSFV
ncbi:SECIS-binding protein 2 [Carabus blaptoides fortunei]